MNPEHQVSGFGRTSVDAMRTYTVATNRADTDNKDTAGRGASDQDRHQAGALDPLRGVYHFVGGAILYSVFTGIPDFVNG